MCQLDLSLSLVLAVFNAAKKRCNNGLSRPVRWAALLARPHAEIHRPSPVKPIPPITQIPLEATPES